MNAADLFMLCAGVFSITILGVVTIVVPILLVLGGAP